MKPVSVHDYYQCKRCYGDISVDLASLTDFYLPLIGSDAFALYLALTREDSSAHPHEPLVITLGITLGEFEKAMSALEAVGLIRTFVGETAGATLFVYCLYAPLHTLDFASDIMLSGTLKGKLGLDEYERIYSRHKGEKAVDDMEEISVSFPDFFKPSFDAQFYLSKTKGLELLGKASARTGFDSVAYSRELENLGLRKGILSEEELSKVGQIASLYSISEKLMAELSFDCIKLNAPVGKKLNLENLSALAYKATCIPSLQEDKGESSEVTGDSETAKMIRLMDELSPSAFLKVMQKNHNPAKVDLKLLEHLRMDLGVPNPCVNALVFYTLAKQGNQLPWPYCEKLAAALVREGCRSARDAMDYFSRGNRRKKKAPMQPSKTKEMPVKPALAHNDEEVSDEEVEEALKDLFED